MLICLTISPIGWAKGWQVDAGGEVHCVLRSGKADIFDGYQDTVINWRITADEFVMESKAPLDGSFDDLTVSTQQLDADAEEALQQAEERLRDARKFSTEDSALLQEQISEHQQELDRVTSHKWYKDYSHNPINAKRLDDRFAAANEKLVPLQQRMAGLQRYRDALADKQAAEARLAELKEFPAVKGEMAGERKSVSFARNREILLEQFLHGTQVRASLRFWPTWPATGPQEGHIGLQGFAEAYAEFQRCLAP